MGIVLALDFTCNNTRLASGPLISYNWCFNLFYYWEEILFWIWPIKRALQFQILVSVGCSWIHIKDIERRWIINQSIHHFVDLKIIKYMPVICYINLDSPLSGLLRFYKGHRYDIWGIQCWSRNLFFLATLGFTTK